MAGSERLDPKVLKTAGVLIFGILAVVFDTTIVGVALHSLAADLHTTVATVQWVTTAYLLALGMTVPLSTWATARFGGKRVWLFSLVVFLAGSVAASAAWNAPALIAGRVVQGIGGGLMLPVMTTLIVHAAGGRLLGRVTSIISLPALLGPILGPLAGGLILTHLSWRWMFWINIPFCVAGFVLAALFLERDEPSSRPRQDVAGLALLAPGIAALLLGLSEASDGGVGHARVLVPLICGVVLLVAFGLYAARRTDPLVDLRLFTHRPTSSGSAVLFFSGFALYGALFLLPLFYQQVRATSALDAGIALIPQGIGTLLSRSLAGRLTDRIGARIVTVTGFLIVAAATLPFAYADAHASPWVLAGVLLLRGIGLGAVTVPVMAVAYLGLGREQVAHASALVRIAQQIGGSFGTAVTAVILQYAVTGSGDLMTAYHRTFWWSTAFAALAALLSLTLPGRDAAAADSGQAAPRGPSEDARAGSDTGEPMRDRV
ncbi:MDR family MFS transporter [Thermobispora bispora]|uniref:Drug resistance transporter, EmrB/QacA subfamily n=1 Tax=Thermobispora bispora (strain ATCC 19993 / DSM 43833 / CBS 139.67 / JCM 10125 / KCTC 9307 / NBRC 14880 / R51) TaxID=469371 RepID=D6Y8Y9_THEBD|nr:MDR family MFS transporter [Thermobispora bispora]ADG89951.1 drug resistance transporter, EmrB/QacA subfamily [Thermobispora bispora DSM 43833]